MQQVLLISPYFPPMGVIGAKRPLHLCRHLPDFGWEPIVLAADPSDSMLDSRLSEFVPENLPVSYDYDASFWRQLLPARRSPKSTAKGSQRRLQLPLWLQYATAYDRYRIHHRAAVRAGLHLIEQHKPALIHVIADPWSGLLVAESLHKRTGVPFLCDFRDPWSQHEHKMAVCPPWTRAQIRRSELRVFSAASRVILNSETCRQKYVDAYQGRLPAGHFARVRNAFDRGLFKETDSSPGETFTSSYFGTFRFLVGALPLLEGFRAFVDHRQLTPEKAQLQFAGTMQASDWEEIERLKLEAYVTLHPPIAYEDSLSFLKGSHALILVADKTRTLQIPGKLYDYLAADRPILGISANQEVNQILSETHTGISADPDNPTEIANAFGTLYDQQQANQNTLASNRNAVELFSAQEQSRQIAAIYEEILALNPVAS